MIRFSQGCKWWLGALALLLTFVTPANAKIEAKKGKKYKLTRQHGPWMIMVTSMRGTTTEEHKRAEAAAYDVVYELRLNGIPAYVYKTGAIVDHVESYNRQGQATKKIMAQQRPEVAVLAGNYEDNLENSATGKVAHKTLEFIKRFRPQALEAHARLLDAASEQMSSEFKGANFREKKHYGPLYKAHLAPNPLLTPQEVASRRKDPLLVELNVGQPFSIAENKGRYTLVVATFEGKSTITLSRANELDSVIKAGSLDESGYLAMALANTMRVQRNLPAYAFHDKYRSVVTVGEFNSPDDPKISMYIEQFRAKPKFDQNRRREVTVAEAFKIEGQNGQPDKVWVMDPMPQLIPVPKFK